VAWVEINDSWGLVDKTGAIRIKPVFDYVDDFHEGLAFVKYGESKGYIDKTGVFVGKPFRGLHAYSFENGIAAFSANEKCGYLDSPDHVLISPRFDSCCPFYSEQARVEVWQRDSVVCAKFCIFSTAYVRSSAAADENAQPGLVGGSALVNATMPRTSHLNGAKQSSKHSEVIS